MIHQRQALTSRRLDILEAAWRLIAERGYHQVRIADIAAACGTSTGTVHYHFPGKDDVLTEALHFCVTRAVERQRVELTALTDARDRMHRLIDMQLPTDGQMREEWSLWLQFWAEASRRPDLRAAHNHFYEQWQNTVVLIVKRGQRQGTFVADVDAATCALAFTAMVDGLALKILTGTGLTVPVMRTLLRDFVERELTSPQGPLRRGRAKIG